MILVRESYANLSVIYWCYWTPTLMLNPVRCAGSLFIGLFTTESQQTAGRLTSICRRFNRCFCRRFRFHEWIWTIPYWRIGFLIVQSNKHDCWWSMAVHGGQVGVECFLSSQLLVKVPHQAATLHLGLSTDCGRSQMAAHFSQSATFLASLLTDLE